MVLTGDNGSGKTNLLEAVSLLSPGRGLRRATYREIARVGGSGGFAVRASVEAAGETVKLATLVRQTAEGQTPRTVTVDEADGQPSDTLLDFCRILWLVPAMDGLFTGPAADRRRFLDRLVLSLDPAHARRATDYEKAMRARNRLLSEDRRNDSWLSAIERQMAELGLATALARAEIVARLTAYGEGAGRRLGTFPAADLVLESGYAPLPEGRPAVEIEDEIAERLRRGRPIDRAAGRTIEGPHRADLSVIHRDKAMPASLASTGEQKALLVGLILSHAELVATTAAMKPILLLDEIAAHLDAGRRATLFEIVDTLGLQAFMTGTDAALFSAIAGHAQMLRVTAGRIDE